MILFFFKQKTAYEMRISDWSSDVCSSDLVAYRLDRQLFVLKIAGAIHAAILLHQLFQIELRCDLGHSALTVLIRRIDSRQPHPLFIERFERIAVDNARVLDVDRNWQIGRASCRERGWEYV